MPSRFANMTGGARYSPRLSREGKLELTKAPRSLDRGCGNSRRFPPGEARADRSVRSVSETRRHPFPFPCSLVYFSEGGLVDLQFRASNDINVPSKLAHCLSGMRPDDLPLRAFIHILISISIPSQARA